MTQGRVTNLNCSYDCGSKRQGVGKSMPGTKKSVVSDLGSKCLYVVVTFLTSC